MERAMDFNSRVAALLAVAVYSEKQDEEEFKKWLPKGWSKRSTTEHAQSGLYAILTVKVRFREMNAIACTLGNFVGANLFSSLV